MGSGSVGLLSLILRRRRRLLVLVCAGAVLSIGLAVSLTGLSLASGFPDVPSSHPYYAAITDLASRGIIGGYVNGDFGPGDPVTRQQFAKMIVLTGGYPVSVDVVCPFVDVAVPTGPDPPYPSKYVAVCAAKGITTGKTPTTFDPTGKITRYQVVSMVVRMADDLRPGLLVAPPSGYRGIGHWGNDGTHGANALRAQYNGLLDGLDLSILKPTANMPREEVAQVLHNLLGKLPPAATTTTSGTTTTISGTTTTSGTSTTSESTTTSETSTTSSSSTTTTQPPAGGVTTYSGSDDQIVAIQKPAGPVLVTVRGNADAGFFAISAYGPGVDGPDTYNYLLLATADPYEGTLLLDYWYEGDEPSTTSLEVLATGPWSIEIRPLSSARQLGTPGQIQGAGDDVILLDGSPGTAHIVGNAESAGYFGVVGYYSRTGDYDLLVDTFDPCDTTVAFSAPNAVLLEIRATGPWSISTAH